MKRPTMAAALLLTAASGPFAWAQAPAATDAHHPPASTAQAPAPSTTPPGQPGTGGMPMMNMMGGTMPMMGMMGHMPTTGMMPMMGMMRMMGMGPMGGMATIDRVEGRIAFLRAELKITEAQASAWNAFADALRANAKKLGEIRASIMPPPGSGQAQPQTVADRLALQERWLQARLEGTRAIRSAFVTLYATLSDDQKKAAEELLPPHLGMGMMATMAGAMGGGQMGPGAMPGQTAPGQMPPGGMMPGPMMPQMPQPGR